MKLLFVANTDWFLYNFHLAHAKYMRDQGFEVIFVSPPGEYVNVIQSFGFQWVNWKVARQLNNPIREFSSIRHLAQIYRQLSPDLVHHFTIKPVLYGTMVARQLGLRSIVNNITGRGYIFLSEARTARLVRPVIQLMLKFVLTDSCEVIFENSDDRDDFLNRSLVLKKQTHLIQGVGADPNRFSPSDELPGPPVILYAGRLLWEKGLRTLIEAGKILRQRGLDFRLALAGYLDPGNPSAITEDDLQKWIAEGAVEWWGFQRNMEDVFKKCHIVVLPTYYGEGVPTILIEAAAAGRPSVASNISGCRAIVKDGTNGLIVPPREAIAFANALEKLIKSSSLRQKMGREGRRIFMENFTQEIINRQTLEVYKKVSNKFKLCN